MPAELKHLLEVRSQLVTEVMQYLSELASRIAELPAYYPAHLRPDSQGRTHFDEIRQVVQVVEDRTAYDQWLAKEKEQARAAGEVLERLAYAPHRSRPEQEGGIKERERPESPVRVAWNERAGTRFKRAWILGDPGFGKTWLLRYEARRLAQEGWEKLDKRVIGLAALEVPIFTRLSDLAHSRGDIAKVLVKGIGEGRSKAFCDFVRAKLMTTQCVLLLDAWDEVQPGPRQRLGERLEKFARLYPHPRMLLTSRLVGYTGSPIRGVQELELLAFDQPQVRAFARVWFGEGGTEQPFLAMLRQNLPVRGLARIPLMLAFLCRVYTECQKDGSSFPSRRGELYDRCLRGLLRDWKVDDEKSVAPKYITASGSYVEAQLELLQAVGYSLFVEGYEQFNEGVLRQKVMAWLRGLRPPHEFFGKNPTALIEEFKRDGIFITAGEGKVGQGADLLFLHRTFQEYLTACCMAQQEDGIEQALSHVYDPDWHEVLRLLGGTLKDRQEVHRYIKLLLDENKRDLLCRPLLLAVAAAVEAAQESIAAKFSQGLMKQMIDLYCCSPRWLDRGVLRFLVAEWGMRGTALLSSHLQDKDTDVRAAVCEALGETGSEHGVELLVPYLQDTEDSVRMMAHRALGRIGSRRAVELMMPHLRDTNPWICKAVCEALGETGSEHGVELLAPYLQDKSETVRHFAVEALAMIGSERGVELLRACIQDENARMRHYACWALGKIGSEHGVELLRTCIQDENAGVCEAACEALGLAMKQVCQLSFPGRLGSQPELRH